MVNVSGGGLKLLKSVGAMSWELLETAQLWPYLFSFADSAVLGSFARACSGISVVALSVWRERLAAVRPWGALLSSSFALPGSLFVVRETLRESLVQRITRYVGEPEASSVLLARLSRLNIANARRHRITAISHHLAVRSAGRQRAQNNPQFFYLNH
jgi:hypothetical protein